MATPVSRLYKELTTMAGEYLDEQGLKLVEDAFVFASKAHKGQFRQSGGEYIGHPLATAMTLVRMRQQDVTLAAALLHDVLEDCGVTRAEISSRFGETVADLVSGVTKLKRLDSAKRGSIGASADAYNLRKMFVAMARDVRVVLVKLADRLHNVQTLKHLDQTQRRRIARETLDIYAPIAHRLGISQIRWQLEDGAFKHLLPAKYRSISRRIARRRQEREEITSQASFQLAELLAKQGVKCEVHGRPKHLYSIYRKMERYREMGREFSDIYDLIALRIIVTSDGTHDCYRTLNLVHDLWLPIPNQFDDYIANPKANFYQSLHTVVIGPHGRPLEIQIRTKEMHHAAEDGIAAHWSYKEGLKSNRDMWFGRALTELQQTLLEDQQEVSDDSEYVDNVRADLLGGHIFVFTPKGEVVEISSGATPLDFAYKIHTDLGHNCVGAKVNGRIMALNYRLKNGDIVEVRKSRRPHAPSLDWLNPDRGYLHTSSAKSKVRAWFRSMERVATIEVGRDILKREKQNLGIERKDQEVADWLGYSSVETLEFDLGSGKITSDQFTRKLVPKVYPDIESQNGDSDAPAYSGVQAIAVPDASGLAKRIPACCLTVRHGDKIAGYLTHDKAVSIHRMECNNLLLASETHQVVETGWRATTDNRQAKIQIVGTNRLGLIRDLASVLAAEKVSIGSIFSDDNANPESDKVSVRIALYATGSEQLGRVITRIRAIPGVTTVARHDAG